MPLTTMKPATTHKNTVRATVPSPQTTPDPAAAGRGWPRPLTVPAPTSRPATSRPATHPETPPPATKKPRRASADPSTPISTKKPTRPGRTAPDPSPSPHGAASSSTASSSPGSTTSGNTTSSLADSPLASLAALPDGQQWFTVRETATILGYSAQFVRKCLEDGRILGYTHLTGARGSQCRRSIHRVPRTSLVLHLTQTANFTPPDLENTLLDLLRRLPPSTRAKLYAQCPP